VTGGATPETRASRGLARVDVLLWLGYALLAAGLFGPAFTITPRLGDLTEVLRSAGVLEAPRTLSIAGSLGELWQRREVFLFLVLGVTGFLVPVAKLAVFQEEARRRRLGLPRTRGLAAAEAVGRWAFTDVFAAALLVIRLKDVEAGPRMELEWGFFAYAAAAILTFAVSMRLRPHRPPAG